MSRFLAIKYKLIDVTVYIASAFNVIICIPNLKIN